MRLLAILCSTLALVSCGGSPLAPAPPQVAGTWSGTMETGNFGTQTIHVTLAQNDRVLTGSWTSDNGWNGTVVGAVQPSGSFSGTMTISVAASGGAACTGTATVGGAFTTSLFSLGSTGFSGTCGGLPEDLTIVTRR